MKDDESNQLVTKVDIEISKLKLEIENLKKTSRLEIDALKDVIKHGINSRSEVIFTCKFMCIKQFFGPKQSRFSAPFYCQSKSLKSSWFKCVYNFFFL